MEKQMPDTDDNQHAEAGTEIIYDVIGRRAHVTAVFALDQLEYVVEQIKENLQCWAPSAGLGQPLEARRYRIEIVRIFAEGEIDSERMKADFPHHDWSQEDPPIPHTFVDDMPQTMAVAALNAGLVVASTATPALNGTYAIDQLSQMDIIAIETSLIAGKGFPGGATTFNYADMSGVMHSFTQANFTDFAAAVRDYVYVLKSVIAGASTTLPPATATIV